jgi:hypothetical protein
MTLFKSRALQLLEQEKELQEKNARECYDILSNWHSPVPVITPTVALPVLAAIEDTKAFGYNYSHLPSRFPDRQKRWSEI